LRLTHTRRTPYFRTKLADAPETTHWKLSSAVPVEAFRLVAQYLYLDELPRELVDPRSSTSEEEVFKGIDKISKQLEVEKLWEAALTQDDRRLARQRYQDEIQRAQEQIESFFKEHVVRHKMVVDTKKVNEIKWRQDNSIFADCLLRADDGNGDDEDGIGDERETSTIGANGIPIEPAPRTPDQKETSRKPKKSTVFPVHKAMLIRSPYFETMFSSEFIEAQESEHLHIIKVDCSPEVLEIILTFMYTEKSDCPLDLALELLYTSDMLLMDRLKSKAAQVISTLGSATGNILVDRTHSEGESEQIEAEPINVYDVIHAAWDLRVQRLEEFAARYLAYRLEDYIDEPEFADLIQESASRLKLRQETDSIELLDDLRYYLSERFRLRFEDAGLDEMLDEEGEIRPEAVEELVAANGEGGEIAKEADSNGAATDATPGAAHDDISPQKEGDGVKTLEGEVVDDEFDLDAMNYQILLKKIDNMLERLKLDA
jgi:ankyrin repeat and BTB/POZ domain-containing protein 1